MNNNLDFDIQKSALVARKNTCGCDVVAHLSDNCIESCWSRAQQQNWHRNPNEMSRAGVCTIRRMPEAHCRGDGG